MMSGLTGRYTSSSDGYFRPLKHFHVLMKLKVQFEEPLKFPNRILDYSTNFSLDMPERAAHQVAALILPE